MAVLAYALGIMAIAGAFTIAMVVRVVGVPSPAIEQIGEAPGPFAGCPGDQIAYELTLVVNRPVILFAVSSILAGQDGAGRTVQFASGSDMAITSRPEGGALVTGFVRFEIPELPAGDYQRVTGFGTWSEESDAVFVPVNFSVLAECE